MRPTLAYLLVLLVLVGCPDGATNDIRRETQAIHLPSPWSELASHRPPLHIQDTVWQRTTSSEKACVQAIEGARGDVNLDWYAAAITLLPYFPGTKTRMTANQLLTFIRRNINDFVDPCSARFELRDFAQDARFYAENTANTLGAILTIDMYDPILFCQWAEDGSVVVSAAGQDYWIFSTIKIQGDSWHPVHGNREFGFGESGGTYYFYTKAVDRVSRWQWAPDDEVFKRGHWAWLSLRKRLTNFVNANGGAATEDPVQRERKSWDWVQTNYWSPTVHWINACDHAEPTCPDSYCGIGETACSCPQDCASSPSDGCCTHDETTCDDPVCDGTCCTKYGCEPGENCTICPQDCGSCPCQPATCGPSDCGLISDGCEGIVDCGSCQCTPRTCGSSCGTISDGCGGSIYCGSCECVPRTCKSYWCGKYADGCGGTIRCSGGCIIE